MQTNTPDPIQVAFSVGFGPFLIPLSGKIPILRGWPDLPPTTEDTVRAWVADDRNLGARCGPDSGIFVVDDDRPRYPEDTSNSIVLPPTPFRVLSPTGSIHHYYAWHDGVRNSASGALGNHVDVRANGGQVVYAGSRHPVARGTYRLDATGPPAECSQELLDLLSAPAPVAAPAVVRTTRATGYAETALASELARVAAAPEGGRNDQLNRSAFSLGQLAAGGALDPARVAEALLQATPLDDREATATIQSGMTAGAEHPRSAPAPDPPRTEDTGRRDVLLPGLHTMPDWSTVEQDALTFARAVVRRLNSSSVYRRGGIPGSLARDQFRALDPPAVKEIVAASVRTTATKPPTKAAADAGEAPRVVFSPLGSQHASDLLSHLGRDDSGTVRDLLGIVPHPCYYSDDLIRARAGWNPLPGADGGIYVSGDPGIQPLDLDDAVAVLEDLVCDFPFQSAADKTNFFGLLLTPILRHTINGPVPLHLVGAPDAGAGKTLLASVVLGCALLGRPVPCTVLGESEEERSKAFLAMLLQGDSIICLDNVAAKLDSPSLAALTTGDEYRARLLGRSETASVPVRATVVATGNNVQLSGEIARRTVPISLIEPVPGRKYRHPRLASWAASQRARVLGALLGLVESWRASGAAPGAVALPSYEAWSETVSGVLAVAGWTDHCSGAAAWRAERNYSGVAQAEFVRVWYDRRGSEHVGLQELLALADAYELLAGDLEAATDRGRQTRMGRVMRRLLDRRFGDVYVRGSSVGRGKRARFWVGS